MAVHRQAQRNGRPLSDGCAGVTANAGQGLTQVHGMYRMALPPLFDLAGNSRARVTVEMSRPTATVGACPARPSTRPWCGRPVLGTPRVASAWTASSVAAGATPTGGPVIGA